jgi:hypothetical protein
VSAQDQQLTEQTEPLKRLLSGVPRAVRPLLERQLWRQYQQALEALRAEMQNAHRERAQVWQRITALKTSGLPAPEHIPTLIELERTAREAGGTAYTDVEKVVFEEMARLSHPDLLPSLVEAFQYHRQYDQFVRRRREYSVDIAATIAARTRNPQATSALVEMLSHPTPEIRGVALVIVYETYEREGGEMPTPLLDHFWQLGRNDPDRRVRQTALALLQRLGHITYAEAMEYLNK